MNNEKHVLGTAVTITSKVKTDSDPDGVKMDIYNPDGSIHTADIVMYDNGDDTWSGVFQSLVDNKDGEYMVETKATKGSYTARDRKNFWLSEHK